MCKFVYIVRTDQNPPGSCQPFSILYIITMTACAAAYRATCGLTKALHYVFFVNTLMYPSFWKESRIISYRVNLFKNHDSWF